MKSFKDLAESSLSRIQKYWIEYDTGTITAFRGAEECGLGASITKKQNKGRNGILHSKLLNRGYGVTRIKGSWFENAGKEKNESSFFVVDLKKSGKLKKDLINLGTDFDQDAIIYADKGSDYYGISTNKCPDSEPGKGKIGIEEKFGKPKFGKTGIYGFSRVNNRAFVFESGFELRTKMSYYPTEIRSINRIDDTDWRERIL